MFPNLFRPPLFSQEGQAIHLNAKNKHTAAKKAFDLKRYHNAADLYTEALQLAVKIDNNNLQVSLLFTDRSKLFCVMKEYHQAIKDAEMSINCKPTYMQGPLRLAEAYIGLGYHAKAFEICRTAMDTFDTSAEMKVSFLKLLISLAPKLSDGYEAIGDLPIAPDVWNDVIECLAGEGSWETLNIVLMGTDEAPGIVTPDDIGDIKLSGLVDFCSESTWKQWGEKLAIHLLKHGAPHQTLCPQNKYPLHAALDRALKTGTYGLLKNLLSQSAAKGNVNVQDEDGNTLLHNACRYKQSSKSTAISLLLNYKVDPDTRNKAENLPIDLLSSNDADREVIIKHMKRLQIGPIDISQTAVVPKTPASLEAARNASADAIIPDSDLNPSVCGASFDNIHGNIQTNTYGQQGTSPAPVFVKLDWTKKDVQTWLERNSLGLLKKKFSEVDGPMLAELKMMQASSAEAFFKLLEESLHLSFIEIVKISRVIRDCH